MLNIFKFLLGICFVSATIYFVVKGITFRVSNVLDKESHKLRAIYRTIAIFCGMISFEIYYQTLDVLICLPILLILVWITYFIAIAQINYLKK